MSGNHDWGAGAAGVFSPATARVVKAAVFGLLAISLYACATKRSGYDVPAMPLPARYKNSPAEESIVSASKLVKPAVKSDSSAASQDVAMAEWWRSFGNSELVELADRSLANNQDLRIATIRLAQAKTRVDQARAGTLPTITAPIGMANQAPGGAVGGGIPVGSDNRASQKSYQASVRGSWRLDVWGEQRSLVEQAQFQLWQAAFERDNVQRNTLAGLASAYVEFLSLNDRLRVARETEAVLTGMLATIMKRVEVGDATLVDLDQQTAGIFAARAAIPSLEQQREETLTNIAFLVGTVPGSLKLSADGLDALVPPGVIPALPSSLLLRRPDIRIAEARLLAADANVDVARARILPNVDLSSQIGYSALALAGLFQPASLFWNALGSVTASIFDGGRLASEKENAKSVHEEMVESYARSIFQAVKEVESALVSIRTTGKRLEDQQQVVVSGRRAWDSSAQMYAVGGVDYMALLDSERNHQRYLDEYQRLKMEHYRGYINLFQAVGGGVDPGEKLPGSGVRPSQAGGDASGSIALAASPTLSAGDAPDWVARSLAEEKASAPAGNFWQVELPGLYHRSTIDATWRDLRTRYPKLTENRLVRPLLNGRIEESADSQIAWYRVYIGKFASPEPAHEFCAALQAGYQRCRVVAWGSDETVAVPPVAQQSAAPVAATRPTRSN